MVTKTYDQIIAEGHIVVTDTEESFKTKLGNFIIVWKRISKFKFQRLEQYREGVNV